jgi:hypothetical protein
MMFLGVLRLLLLLALRLLNLLVLLLASIVGPTGPGRAGVAGPKPRRGEVGTPRQVSGSTPATFDLTVLIIIPAGRDTLVDAMVRGCSQRAAGRGASPRRLRRALLGGGAGRSGEFEEAGQLRLPFGVASLSITRRRAARAAALASVRLVGLRGSSPGGGAGAVQCAHLGCVHFRLGRAGPLVGLDRADPCGSSCSSGPGRSGGKSASSPFARLWAECWPSRAALVVTALMLWQRAGPRPSLLSHSLSRLLCHDLLTSRSRIVFIFFFLFLALRLSISFFLALSLSYSLCGDGERPDQGCWACRCEYRPQLQPVPGGDLPD